MFRFILFSCVWSKNEDNDVNKLPDSISIYDYLSTIESEENDSKNKIAVINIEGAISTGESMYGIAGSDTIVKNIRKAIDQNSYSIYLEVNLDNLENRLKSSKKRPLLNKNSNNSLYLIRINS